MKVLLVNGSPHREGCTYTALCAVSEALNQNGIDTDHWQRIMMALYLERRSTGQELPVQSLLFWTVLFMPI